MVALGTKLRQLRQERQWTQKQIAKQIGVTASIVSAYETGIRFPSYEALIKLARLYHVSTDYLLGVSTKRSADSQHLVSLDGLTPERIMLVLQLIETLKN